MDLNRSLKEMGKNIFFLDSGSRWMKIEQMDYKWLPDSSRHKWVEKKFKGNEGKTTKKLKISI